MEARLREEGISVIMPVHGGIDPTHFMRALQSIAEQTHRPHEVVVVVDGPVPEATQDVLQSFDSLIDGLHVKRLSANMGQGRANDVALRLAASEWIAKADADDVNHRTRLERQWQFVHETGVDVCGSSMLEFEGPEGNVVGIRERPRTHDEIARAMRLNNPVNHPTSFYRRSRALRAGSYRPMRFAEDYDLFARMLRDGARFGNIIEPLVSFRASGAMYRRRSVRTIWRDELQLQARLLDYGITSRADFLRNLSLRLGFSLLPAPILREVHRRFISGREGGRAGERPTS